MNQKYPNIEKLKSKKLLDALFTSGNKLNKYPIKLVYKKIDFKDECFFKVGVSVPKRNFKKAVDRNKIKRLMREAYRLNKHIIQNEKNNKYVCMLLFIGKETPDFEELNTKVNKLLVKFNEKENSI